MTVSETWKVAELTASPPVHGHHAGYLRFRQTAAVIAVDIGSYNVFVLAPEGTGWVTGAHLIKILVQCFQRSDISSYS